MRGALRSSPEGPGTDRVLQRNSENHRTVVWGKKAKDAVASELNVCERTTHLKWERKYRKGGDDVLIRKKAPGRPAYKKPAAAQVKSHT